MASTLPDNPSLERLLAEARARQRGVDGLTLDGAQLAVARHYGFSGWAALVGYLAIVDELTVDLSEVDESADYGRSVLCVVVATVRRE